MDDKKFQEIKRRLLNFDGFEDNLETTIGYGLELITAYEQAKCDVLNLRNDASHFNADHRHAHEYIERLKVDNHDLHAQLVALQDELTKCVYWNKFWKESCKRRTRCIVKQKAKIANLHKALDASHAVNKVALHTMEIQNITIELLETNRGE